ncbi:MAG: hypothetical protein WAM54_06395 [Nitrososphaeraceae archaeon]|jgi:hypothetical protein
MDLTTNGVVVTDAIKYVQGKMDHLNESEKKLLQDIKDKGIEMKYTKAEVEDTGEVNSPLGLEPEEQLTHNKVF